MLNKEFSVNIANFRREYKQAALEEAQMPSFPHLFFEQWLQEALQSPMIEPTAMFLATVSDNGQPAVRTVLLKGHSQEGLLFFTNYLSRKGHEIEAQNRVALLFYWDLLERQVRIEGIVEKVPAEVSDNYFQQRPKESQLGAIASPQSQVIESRKQLDDVYQHLSDQYANVSGTVPRPLHWGGYIVRPTAYEFWQGRAGRLHDRLQYVFQPETGQWLLQRLAP